MILYIIIALFLVFLTWILLAPLVIQVDTASGRYRVMLPGVLTVKAVPADGLFFVRAWIFFIPLKFDPFRPGKRKDGKKETGKKKRRKGFRMSAGKARKILRAIRIRRLAIDVDTDDYVLNAWLVPALAVANRYDNIEMRVNFEGNLFMHMDLRTRPGRILWILLTKR